MCVADALYMLLGVTPENKGAEVLVLLEKWRDKKVSCMSLQSANDLTYWMYITATHLLLILVYAVESGILHSCRNEREPHSEFSSRAVACVMSLFFACSLKKLTFETHSTCRQMCGNQPE